MTSRIWLSDARCRPPEARWPSRGSPRLQAAASRRHRPDNRRRSGSRAETPGLGPPARPAIRSRRDCSTSRGTRIPQSALRGCSGAGRSVHRNRSDTTNFAAQRHPTLRRQCARDRGRTVARTSAILPTRFLRDSRGSTQCDKDKTGARKPVGRTSSASVASGPRRRHRSRKSIKTLSPRERLFLARPDVWNGRGTRRRSVSFSPDERGVPTAGNPQAGSCGPSRMYEAVVEGSGQGAVNLHHPSEAPRRAQGLRAIDDGPSAGGRCWDRSR